MITVAGGGGGGGQAGVLRFELPSYVTIDGDPVTIAVQRTGGTAGAVGATVIIPLGDGTVVNLPVSWADGDGTDKTVTTPATGFPPPGGGIGSSEVTLGAATGGVGIDPIRGKALVLVAPAGSGPLVLLALLFRVLLAAAGPWLIVALAAAGLYGAWASRRRSEGPGRGSGDAMKNRIGAMALVAVVLAGTPCCTGAWEGNIVFTAPPELNPRLRRDGNPPDAASGQSGLDPYRGPFRNGDPETEIVSELYPDLGGDEEKLMQSNCFWVSSPPAAEGDSVRLSWEVVVSVERSPLHLDCSSPSRFGLCSFRDPVDGRWLVFYNPHEEAPLCPGDSAEPAGPLAIPLAIHLNYPTEDIDGTFSVETVWDETLVFMSEVLAVKEVLNGESKPHRECPGDVSAFTPFAGAERDVELYGPAQCSRHPESGLYYGCNRWRCRARPPGDLPPGEVTYRIRAPDAEVLQKDLQPNVMSVQGSATLTRVMAPQGSGSYAWQTSFSAGEGPGRWHENFSPMIRVEQVRVYRLEGGIEKPVALDPANPVLQLAGSTAEGTVQVWSCSGQQEDDGVYFPIFPQGGCRRADQAEPTLLTTPTYVHRHLEDTVGPLAVPLSWSVTPAGTVAGDLFIEFTVVGRAKESMAMSITSPLDYGPVPLGEERRLTATVENTGGEVAVIDDVYLAGAQASDFSFALPSDPRPLPLPVTGELGAEGLTLALTPSAGEDPPLLAGTVDVTGTLLRVDTADYEGTTQFFNGYSVEFDSGLAFYDDPDADFVRDPLPEGSFGLSLPVYARREPPFELLPGESFEAVVTVSPDGYNQRWGELHVSAYQLTDPAVRQDFYATLLADGVVPPSIEVLPTSLSFPRGPEDARVWWQPLLVTNPTLFDVERRWEIVGPDAALFEVVSGNEEVTILEPGDAEVFRILYLLPCPGPIPPTQPTAELRIDTGSDVEVVELTGFMPLECVAP